MKKIFIISLLLFFINSSISAQIDDLKDKTEEKKENSDNENNSDTDVSTLTAPDNFCVNSFIHAVFNVAFNMLGQVIINHHLQIMNQINDPSKLSLEVTPTIAYGAHFNDEKVKIYDYFNILPQLHGRWGVLSTDFRYNLLLDFQDFSINSFKSWEWNIFQINIQPADEHLITLGTGISYESFSKTLYNEHLLSYRYKTIDQMFYTQATGRLATDYKFSPVMSDAIFFTEINLNGGVKFMTFNHLFGYFTFGAIYQNYFLSHNIFLVQTGLTFNIH
jgi:hypothetical protein